MMGAADRRAPERRVIDADDPEKLREAAEELSCPPELVAEAVEKVGPIRTAVELYLSAPKP